MAQRNYWYLDNENVIKKGIKDFKWEPGMSISQRRKSCINLHEALKKDGKNPLDISSASTEELGVNLSAFNLTWKNHSIECLYQGSKVYENAGAQHQLYNMSPRQAKQSMKTLGNDKIIGFNFEGNDYPIVPRTLFYDWLYLHGLIENYGENFDFSMYDCFTDIQATINVYACQARAVCEYVAMQKTNTFYALNDINLFVKWHMIFVKG
jgi:hypothetical protein